MADEIERARRAPRRFEAVTGKKGLPTLRGPGPDGRLLHIHSLVDPVSEARQRLDRLDISPDRAVMLLGVGLGYMLQEMLRGPMPRVALAIEPYPEALAAAFETHDLTQVLSNPRFVLLTGGDPEAFRPELTGFFTDYAQTNIHMDFLPHVKADTAFVNAFQAVFDSVKNTCIGIVATRRFFLEHNRCNIAANFGRMANSADVSSLKNIFRGAPGLIVGPAPSLEKQRAWMPEMSRRCVVIALGSALRPLARMGVKPHLALFIDPQDAIRNQIAGLEPSDTPCLAPDTCHPSAIEHFQGNGLVFPALDSPILTLLTKKFGRYGSMPTDISVAVFALHVAKHLGLRSAGVIGVDFLLRGRTRYADSPMAASSRATSSLTETTVWGTPGPTEDDLSHYRRNFTDQVRRVGLPIVDIRETGAMIEGAERMSPKEFILQSPADRLPRDAFAKLRDKMGEISRTRRTAKRELGRECVQSLARIEELISTALQEADRLEPQLAADAIPPEIVTAAFGAVDGPINKMFREIAWPLAADEFMWQRLSAALQQQINVTERGAEGHREPWKARREFLESSAPMIGKIRKALEQSLESM